MPMHDLESLLEDPHIVATDFFPVVDHPTEGRIRSMKPSARWSETPVETNRLAPRLSEHSAEILREAGFSADEIAAHGARRRHQGRAQHIGSRTWISRCQPTRNRSATRSAKICSRFDDAYWLKKDKEGGYPADFHRALADAGWLGICIPEEYGGSGLGITDAAIMMRDHRGIRRRHVGCFRRAHERVRAQSRGRVRHQGAVHAHAAADHRRPRQILLCGDRTQHRPQHHAVEDPRGAQGRQIHRQRPEGLDFHRPGRQQDPAAGAHHAAGRGEDADAGPEPVLHRFRQEARHRARDREDGPQARRFQRIVLREFRNPGAKIASAKKAAASNISCTA